jgi:hypothetical protein
MAIDIGFPRSKQVQVRPVGEKDLHVLRQKPPIHEEAR